MNPFAKKVVDKPVETALVKEAIKAHRQSARIKPKSNHIRRLVRNVRKQAKRETRRIKRGLHNEIVAAFERRQFSKSLMRRIRKYRSSRGA